MCNLEVANDAKVGLELRPINMPLPAVVRLNFAIKNLWFTTQLRCMDFLLNCIRISLELYLKQQDQFNGAGAVSTMAR